MRPPGDGEGFGPVPLNTGGSGVDPEPVVDVYGSGAAMLFPHQEWSPAVGSSDASRAVALELLASAAYGEEAISEVIRPSAILPEMATRAVLSELVLRDVRSGGEWLAEPSSWRRYDRPWNDLDGGPGSALLLGTIQVAYGTPTRYEITVFRATISRDGAAAGWTVAGLCNDAFQYGGLTLDSCPRATLAAPPKPFRLR